MLPTTAPAMTDLDDPLLPPSSEELLPLGSLEEGVVVPAAPGEVQSGELLPLLDEDESPLFEVESEPSVDDAEEDDALEEEEEPDEEDAEGEVAVLVAEEVTASVVVAWYQDAAEVDEGEEEDPPAFGFETTAAI